jgi:hypothetical protein
MRSRPKNSIAGKVRKKISDSGPGKLWTYSEFREFPIMAVSAALSRLAKETVIDRVRKGVYFTPHKTRFGYLKPNPMEIAAAVLNSRGIEWVPSGLPAFNGLGLTTQVSPILTLDVPRTIYSLDLGAGNKINATKGIRLNFRKAVAGLGDKERVILDALRELHRIPGSSPAKVVSKIRNLFATKEYSFTKIASRALDEPPRVRAVLGAIGSDIGASRSVLASLKRSLNRSTTFNLGLGNALLSARDWRIR